MPALTLPQWLLLHGLLVYVVATHVLRRRRHRSAAIGWVSFMRLLPYAAPAAHQSPAGAGRRRDAPGLVRVRA